MSDLFGEWISESPCCSDKTKNQGYRIQPAEPGGLLGMAGKDAVPPTPPPAPVLQPQDILHQQLPVCPIEPMFRTFRCRLDPKETAKGTGKQAAEYSVNLAADG